MAEKSSLSTRLLEPGELIGGRYEIVRLIGNGGMASVYLVRDRHGPGGEHGQELALKVLHKEFTEDKTYVERFVREVKLIHDINHPNIVRPHDIGSADGMIYFTMEYVPGSTLEHLMENQEFTNTEIAHLVIKICEGLKAIHEHGIVHRDLKPANILLTNEAEVKIADFGVAREKSSRLTQPNQKLGSLCYIAPEVWLGRDITPAVDFYSLGIMLYELVTGAVPFEDPLPGKMLELHLRERVVAPNEKNSDTPVWLNELILRLLQKSPKDRPKTADEIIALVKKKAFVRSGAFSGTDNQQFQFTEPSVTAQVKRPVRARGKTYVFKLSATRLIEESQNGQDEQPRRKATVVITLPRRAALVLEIEAPSRDVICFGIFLGSLQVLDGFFTSLGVRTWGVYAEGNPLLRAMMHNYGPDAAIFMAKAVAILLVIFVTVIAKRRPVFKNLVGALSGFYLFGAIVPWAIILSKHFGWV